MSHTPPARKQRWRAVLIGASLLLLGGAVILTIQFHRRNPQWQVEAELGWRFQHYDTRTRVDIQVSTSGTNPPPDWYITLSRGYRAGPFHAYMLEVLPKPQSVGTNKLHVGDVLYTKEGREEMGRVITVEKWHEFPDGEDKPGVLVRFTMMPGGEEWVPREKLDKALVGR